MAHQVGAYPSFCSVKTLGVCLLLPGWDATCSPSQGYPQHLIFGSTHLCTWVERGTLGTKCLVQEHNTMLTPAQTWTTKKFHNELQRKKLPWACSVALPVTNGNKVLNEI